MFCNFPILNKYEMICFDMIFQGRKELVRILKSTVNAIYRSIGSVDKSKIMTSYMILLHQLQEVIFALGK